MEKDKKNLIKKILRHFSHHVAADCGPGLQQQPRQLGPEGVRGEARGAGQGSLARGVLYIRVRAGLQQLPDDTQSRVCEVLAPVPALTPPLLSLSAFSHWPGHIGDKSCLSKCIIAEVYEACSCLECEEVQPPGQH